MAEPTLSVDYTQLTQEVAHFLGYGRSGAWSTGGDAATLAEIDGVVQAGYRRFLYPTVVDDQKTPYEWNFLFLADSLTITGGLNFVNMEEDFGGIAKDFVLTAPQNSRAKIEMVAWETILSMPVGTTGQPKYVAVVPTSAPTASVGQRYQAVFWPYPGASDTYTVSYRYNAVPAKLSDSNPYPWGGGKHSETVMESCLAVAESRLDDEESVHSKRFLECLRASIETDKREMRTEGRVYDPSAKNTTLNIDFADLVRETGAFLGYDFDQSTWKPEQKANIDFLCNSGVSSFYNPPPLEGQAAPHQWDFMQVIENIDTVSGKFKYELPGDFGTVMGDMTLGADTEASAL